MSIKHKEGLMILGDKIKVAEKVLGWVYEDVNAHVHIKPFGYHFHTDKPKSSKNRVYVNKWNPDTNHTLFAEVRFRLSDEQWSKVLDLHNEKSGLPIEDAILVHLPKIMDLVIEVIDG